MRTLSFPAPVRALLWALLPLMLLLAGCKNDSDDAAKELAKLVEQHKAEDDATIQAYLTANNITTYERRDSGLYIIWQNRSTTGTTLPVAGSQVKVRYIGRRLSDDIRFDASIDNGTPCGCTSFTVGSVIEGWNEMLQLMRKGDKVIILVPSHLAYGPSGNGSFIPPFTPLKFEMELIDFQ
ncbi:FKBP-type peptidyl-prolyl cis-trans isomerase [Hymenobacter edaphi]|uniref:Peptidyl-prolyl cis-trans isomerase n=1 Tax=Hymenobacter edaphi TaxID=2211146 RepID=A0A328B467_9BACT|nr:FKBP-type peptidyl-prolyl cis-trans isomerase [Hymenobacter edaphi]RAK62252.1 hypothetical protein DLM85_24095 [Hymenobacter edaphi]